MMEVKVFEFEYNGIKYYYTDIAPAEKIVMRKDGKFIVRHKCTRCGGKGQSWWRRDNGICYQCGGSGVYTVKVLKVTKNKTTAERRASTKNQETLEKEKYYKEKALKDNLEYVLRNFGKEFYLVLDTPTHSTYNEREYLKSKKSRWNPSFGCWYSLTNDIENFKLVKINTSKYLTESNSLDFPKISQIIHKVKKEG